MHRSLTGHTIQAVQTEQQTKHADSDEHKQDRESTDLQTDKEDMEFKRLTNIDMNDDETDEQPILTQYIHNEFRDAQINDSLLSSYWTRAKAGSSDFVIRNGLLFKRTPPNVATDKDYLLVVPKAYERQVLEMGHDSKYSGHTGVKKTLNRIQAVFYFPKMSKKIKNHVKSCKECQLTAQSRKRIDIHWKKCSQWNPFALMILVSIFLELNYQKQKPEINT